MEIGKEGGARTCQTRETDLDEWKEKHTDKEENQINRVSRESQRGRDQEREKEEESEREIVAKA